MSKLHENFLVPNTPEDPGRMEPIRQSEHPATPENRGRIADRHGKLSSVRCLTEALRFTIVIPTHGRPQRLRNCLAGLAALDYPRTGFEVIVVDDGGLKPLEPIVQSFEDSLNITLLRQDHSGPAVARNQGSLHARGEWIAFLDDDCVPRPDWLSRLDAASGDPRVMLGGAAVNACEDNTFAGANQFLVDFVTEWFRTNLPSLDFFPSNNIAIHTGSFRAKKGFDSRFRLAGGEDREFCARWLAAGRKLVAVPEAKIDHYHPQSPSRFLGTHFRYGRGAARMHTTMQSSPLKFVAWKLHCELFAAALRNRLGYSPVGLAGLLFVAQAVQALGYFTESFFRPSPNTAELQTTAPPAVVARRFVREPVR